MRRTWILVLLFLSASLAFVPNTSVAQVAETSPFFNLADYGAVGNGKTLCTEVIRKAVDARATARGGTVYIPAGRCLSGAMSVKSNVTLNISEGATLLASTNFEDFPLL